MKNIKFLVVFQQKQNNYLKNYQANFHLQRNI